MKIINRIIANSNKSKGNNVITFFEGLKISKVLFTKDEWYKEGVTVVQIHTRGFQNLDLFFDRVFADDTSHVKKLEILMNLSILMNLIKS